MPLLYDTGILLYRAGIGMASLFNAKAKAWIMGRRSLLEKIRVEVPTGSRPVWFHFASVGEFEQGRPVIEAFRQKQPGIPILLTFFSPSGYNLRKNYDLADHVFYLPMDTAANARQFIEIVQPQMAVFTKYEFWHHYFSELNKHQVPLYLISAIFRPKQAFFRWYGKSYQSILKQVTHFFVQDESSRQLLTSIGLTNVTVSGDTRFDRVYAHAQSPEPIDDVAAFSGGAPVLVAGSTWSADERLLAALAAKHADWKFIIAPHETDGTRIQEIAQAFKDSIRYSHLKSHGHKLASQVLIIDNVGMLSSLYQYGKLAYIGGGFGKGIHNTLEAAAYGLPVIFGPNYQRFREAHELIGVGAARSIATENELAEAFDSFRNNAAAAMEAAEYVARNTGATQIILNRIIPV